MIVTLFTFSYIWSSSGQYPWSSSMSSLCQWPGPTSITLWHISICWQYQMSKSVSLASDSLNESKCLLLTFQSKSPTHSTLLYSINGHVIRNCHQHKDLGILMSSDLHGRPISSQSPPKRTKSFDYLTSLCVLVAAHQQRKCSTYHLSDLNLCTVCRFGAHHLLKKLKLLKMYSVVRRNLFLMTTYQITELIGLNFICKGGSIGAAGAAMAAPLFSSNMATPYDHALID